MDAVKTDHSRSQVSVLCEDLAKKDAEIKSLKDKNATIQAEIDDVQGRFAVKDVELKSLRDKNTALQVEIGELKGQLENKNAEVEESRRLASTREAEKKQLRKEAEKIKGQLLKMKSDDGKTKQVEIDRLTAEIDDLKGQLQIKSTEVKALSQLASTRREEKEQLKKEAESLKGELLTMQQTRNDDGTNKQAEIDRLTGEIRDLEGRLRAKTTQVEDLSRLASTHEEEKEQLAMEAENLKGKLLKMHQVRTDDSKTKQVELERLTAEIVNFKGQLQIKNAQVEDLSQLASTRGEEKEQLENEATQLQGQLLKMQQIRGSLIDDNEAKQVKIDQLLVRLTTQSREIERQGQENDYLKKELARARENIAEAGQGAKFRAGVAVGRPDIAATTPTANGGNTKAASDDRTCPMCQQRFPALSQQEYEQHVQSHF